MAGTEPDGERVLVYDDDHYYLGGVVAEALARSGHAVTFVTPAARVSEWTVNTLEQVRIQRRMLEAGIEIVPSRAVDGASAGAVRTSCVYTSEVEEHAADALVLVTSRLPDDGVAADLRRAGRRLGGRRPHVRPRRRRRAVPGHDRGGGVGRPPVRRAARRAARRRRRPIPARDRRSLAGRLTLSTRTSRRCSPAGPRSSRPCRQARRPTTARRTCSGPGRRWHPVRESPEYV